MPLAIVAEAAPEETGRGGGLFGLPPPPVATTVIAAAAAAAAATAAAASAAAATAVRTTTLHLHPRTSFRHSTVDLKRREQWATMEVEAVSLQALLRTHPGIVGVKLDCQGAERAAIDTVRVLWSSVPFVLPQTCVALC